MLIELNFFKICTQSKWVTAYKVLLRKDDLSDMLCLEPLRRGIGIMIKIYFKNTVRHARGTTQHNQHMWTCAERHRARVLKGSEL